MKDELTAILRTLPVERQVTLKGDSIWITCPLPDHENESTGSFRIYLTGHNASHWRCYGCGKHGNWREAVDALKLPSEARFLASIHPVDPFSDVDNEALFGKKVSARKHESVPWPENKKWRGISYPLLKRLKAEIQFDDRGPKLLFPVLVNGKRVGEIACNVKKDPDPKALNYINSPGPWIKDALFPFDYVKKRLDGDKLLYLVEGVRDPLHLIQMDYLALTTMGSHNWSKKCAALIKALSIERIILLPDPDRAGDQWVEDVYADLSPYMFIDLVKLRRLENGKKAEDPADLSPERMAKIDRILRLKHKAKRNVR